MTPLFVTNIVILVVFNLMLCRPVMEFMNEHSVGTWTSEEFRETREFMMDLFDPWIRYALTCALGAFFVFEFYGRDYSPLVALFAVVVGLCFAALRVTLWPRNQQGAR